MPNFSTIHAVKTKQAFLTNKTNAITTISQQGRHNKMQRHQRKCVRFQISQSTLLTLLAVSGLWAQLTTASPVQLQYNPSSSQQQQQQPSTLKSALPASSASNVRLQQCREGCLEKFATKDDLCQQNSECLTCWEECAKPPPPKIIKTIRESWTLHTVSMLQQDSLVLVDVAWEPLTMPTQCLVTWEVSGGGLMGNLLTESFNVQLSLWPDTKYRVQVTCKNKLTGTMSRSLPLSIDTAEAVLTQDNSEKQSSSQKSLITTLKASSSRVQNKTPPPLTIDESNLSIDSAAVNSADIEDAASVLPYDEDDDRSSETLNQHTNFIFNWHTKNSGLSTVEAMHKPDMNLLTIQILSNMQKPLLFGVVAGTMLLTFVLLLYICLMRQQQRALSDKTALITDAEAHAIEVALPPALTIRKEEHCQHAANCSRYAPKV